LRTIEGARGFCGLSDRIWEIEIDQNAKIAGNEIPTWLQDAFDALSHDKERSLNAFLTTVGRDVEIEGTSARCHCHFVRRDKHGGPRVEQLAEKLAAQLIDYCIPRSRLEEAFAEQKATGSTEAIGRLTQEARSLFSLSETSGEGGEMLLYLLLELELGLPQLLCKMPLKTNPEVHYHGVDGVHGALNADRELALYWCESKLYKSVSKAIQDCFTSLAPFLVDGTTGSAKRDMLLLRQNLDTGNPDLDAELIAFLTDDDPRSTRLEIRGACLIGFSLDEYPDPLGADGREIVAEVAEQVEKWVRRIGDRVVASELSEFELEVFCVPFPSVADFRAALKRGLGLP
jgi:hypothetical protein